MNQFVTFVQYITDYLFGPYQPVYLIDQNTGECLDSSIDWSYILAGVIFCIVLYMVLKCVGGVIRATISK